MKKILLNIKWFDKDLLPTLVFFVINIFVGTYKLYLVLIGLYILFTYILSKDLLKSLWIAFLGVLLFTKAKYFNSVFTLPPGFIDVESQRVSINYFIAFSDGLLVLLLYTIFRTKQQHKKKFPPIKISINELLSIGIIILGIISSSLSTMPGVSFFSLLQITKYFTIYYLVKSIFINKQHTKATFELLFLFILFNAALILLQRLTGGPLGLETEINPWSVYGRFADESQGLYRPGGFTADPNLIASVFTMFIPLIYILSITKNTFNKKFLWVTLVISSLALIFTSSRAAWIITAALIYLGFQVATSIYKVNIPLQIKKHSKQIFVILLLCVLPLIIHRLSTIPSLFKAGGGAIYRYRHIKIATDFMITHPFGIGLNVFQYAITYKYDPEYFMWDSTPAHNILAQIMAGFGVMGLVMFISLFYLLIKEKYLVLYLSKRKNPISCAVLISLIGYILVANVYPWLIKPPISELFWILAGYSQYDL